ncbi:MAG: ABC transporter permease [Gammaproteobacteria bacterium]|nr:ABC transporter permease [Gammaproteobacteria bacterium]
MIKPIWTIARFTFFEAMRNRLFLLTLIGLISVLGLTEFVGELAISETRNMQAILIGAAMRLFAVITIALFVITSVVREFNDKGFDLIASLSLPRHSYYFGKSLGFFLLALVISISTALLLLIYSPLIPVALWFVSLICELAIVIALSLLCLFTFSNVTVAFMVVISFYVLARSMYTLQLVSHSPILEFYDLSQQFLRGLTDAVAFVLPSLHEFTHSEWLAYGVEPGDIIPILIQTVIYLVLLAAAGLFDLYRKNL